MKHKNNYLNQRLLVTGLALMVLVLTPATVFASHLTQQITELEKKNQQSDSSQAVLENEAANLSAKISTLQAEISSLESQITETKRKSDEVQSQIDVAQIELDEQKELLGVNIRAMYIEGDITTMEMLASSNDLSDFVDKQQYRTSVQAKIKVALDKVTALKNELRTQKAMHEKLLTDQEHMQQQLTAQRAETNRLLSLNEGQRSEIENQISQNNQKISQLRQQQASENARFFSGGVPAGVPGGGGYPGKWASAPMDSLIDSWGMYNRECVSYTAWKVWSTGRYMPYWGGRGNAKQWDDNARAENIPTSSTPKAGSVAVSNAGIYGHTMYVEQVYGDGSIQVSDYNQQWDGMYRNYRINAAKASTFVYIYF
jgi:surface antigen/cell division protein FtsB